MAESLDDGEFWLPPKFLNDDDVFLDKYGSNNEKNGVNYSYPFEFPLGFGSPGSSETESDEDEYIAGLTRQMAHSTLENSINGWGVSGSPQSTLCVMGNGCGCKNGSSQGSPTGHSHGSKQEVTLDLLYAAAGEVSKIRKNEEIGYGFHHNRRGLLAHPIPISTHRKPSPVSMPRKNPDIVDDVGVYQQLQAARFLYMRRQQIIEELKLAAVRLGQAKGGSRYMQQQNRGGKNSEFYNGRNCRLVSGSGLSSPQGWAPQKQTMNQGNGSSSSSGMRAVFLGGKRECAGTGVFLPRQAGTVSESRKKPACSTVLVPTRVMQALNLNLDDQNQSCFPPLLNNDASMRNRGENFPSHRKTNLRQNPVLNHDIRLPQEWTY